MGPFEASLFAKETGAELAIPVHYDNPNYPADLNKVKDAFEKQGVNYKILDLGTSCGNLITFSHQRPLEFNIKPFQNIIRFF